MGSWFWYSTAKVATNTSKEPEYNWLQHIETHQRVWLFFYQVSLQKLKLAFDKEECFLKESKIRKIRKKLFVEDNWLFVREQKFACYETSCDSQNFYFTCLFSFENLTERGWNEVVSVAQVCKCNRCMLTLLDEQALGNVARGYVSGFSDHRGHWLPFKVVEHITL